VSSSASLTPSNEEAPTPSLAPPASVAYCTEAFLFQVSTEAFLVSLSRTARSSLLSAVKSSFVTAITAVGIVGSEAAGPLPCPSSGNVTVRSLARLPAEATDDFLPPDLRSSDPSERLVL